MFTDRVTLHLAAGKGGNGTVAWRRQKYIPKGGPAGGDGGRGGSIIIRADNQIFALDWYRNRRTIKAQDGVQGGPSLRKGKQGENLILKVPCGTIVKDANTKALLHDFTQDGEEWIICKGGNGGFGNNHFKSPTNQAPNYCYPGKEGEKADIELELKLIADVGLVGFPNAGKSTLICAITKANVKIAPYPFTTLRPNIGFFDCEDYSRIIIADIPGIIENAHLNRGLGFEFLRHIERTKLLIYILDSSGIDGRTPLDDYRVLRGELEAYNPELLDRPSLVVLNKIDSVDSVGHIEAFKEEFTFKKGVLFEISALNRDGLSDLKSAIQSIYSNLK